jgi:hypothetical protein
MSDTRPNGAPLNGAKRTVSRLANLVSDSRTGRRFHDGDIMKVKACGVES